METEGGEGGITAGPSEVSTTGPPRALGRGRRLKASSPLRAERRPGALISKQKLAKDKEENEAKPAQQGTKNNNGAELGVIEETETEKTNRQDVSHVASGGRGSGTVPPTGDAGGRRGTQTPPAAVAGGRGAPTRVQQQSTRGDNGNNRRKVEEESDEEEESEEEDDEDEETDTSEEERDGNSAAASRSRRRTEKKDKVKQGKEPQGTPTRVWARRKKRTFTAVAPSRVEKEEAGAPEVVLPSYPNPNGENYGVVTRPGDNKRYTRCLKCCLYKVQVPSKKEHVCREDLLGHTWETCPTKNKRAHIKEQYKPSDNNKGEGAVRRGESIVLRKPIVQTQRLQQGRGKTSWFNLQRRRIVINESEEKNT